MTQTLRITSPAAVPWRGDPAPLRWADKAPGTTDDLGLNVAAWLGASAISAVRVAAPLALQGVSIAGGTVILRCGGGTPDTDHTIAWSILADDGRRLDAATRLYVDATPNAAPIVGAGRQSVVALQQTANGLPGSIAVNGSFVTIAPGASYVDANVIAVAFGSVSGGDLPTSPDGLHVGEFWWNGTYLCVAGDSGIPDSPLPTSPDNLRPGIDYWLNGDFVCVA